MKKNKIQILFIHGGMTFRNKKDYLHFLKNRKITIAKKNRWTEQYVDKELTKDFEIIKPRMPLADNAKYKDWEIHFRRYIPYLRPNLILVGSSLGGIFLAKYLSENKFPKKLLSVYLVCPPYDNNSPSLEYLAGGFKLKADLSKISKNCRRLTLLFSQNDKIVPPGQAEKYAKKLPRANIIVYKHIKGHFEVSEFPEIIKMIKNDKKIRS